jgi:hypothetical protein
MKQILKISTLATIGASVGGLLGYLGQCAGSS